MLLRGEREAGDNIRNNATIWITGIIAVLVICAIPACTFMFAVTVIFDAEDDALT